MTHFHTHLTRTKRNWEKARDRKTAALADLNQAIRNASEGGLTQAEIGRALGWPRQRVNSVLGRDS